MSSATTGTSDLKRSPLKRKGANPLKRTPIARGDSALSARTPLARGDKPLTAKTELKQSSNGLQNKTPLKSSSSLSSNATLKSNGPIKSKPKVMTAEEKECRRIVKLRSSGTCEICGKREATDMAHRLAVSQNGQWMPSNMLHACRFCHSYNHDHPQNSFDHGWHLRSGSVPLEEPVLLASFAGEKQWYKLLDNGEKKTQITRS